MLIANGWPAMEAGENIWVAPMILHFHRFWESETMAALTVLGMQKTLPVIGVVTTGALLQNHPLKPPPWTLCNKPAV